MRGFRWFVSMLMIAALVANAAAGRPVVIEEFTATWCPACYGAGRGLDRVEANYDRSKVIVLAYHAQDDFYDEFCDDRMSDLSVNSYPTLWFNGVKKINYGYYASSGEAGVTAMYNTLVNYITQEQQRTANSNPFTITITGSAGPVKPSIDIKIVTKGYPNQVTLFAYITEDGIPYSASNGQTSLSGVVRDYYGYATFTMASAGTKTLNGSLDYTIKYYSASKLHPAIFIQDDVTGEIVGAVGEFTKNAAERDWSLYE